MVQEGGFARRLGAEDGDEMVGEAGIEQLGGFEIAREVRTVCL